MENIKKLLYILSLLSALTINFSCGENDPIEEETTNESINNWILENMNIYYLWNEQIPSGTDRSLNPKEYFEHLLYRAEDRFSVIFENYTDLLDAVNGVETDAGYDFSLKRVNQSDVIGIINYIKSNSPASKTNLKRGDIFHTVNGTKLTISNYADVLDAIYSPHTLGIVNLVNKPDNSIELNPIKDIALSVAKYDENPVFLDTVYTVSDKKIGYIVFNFFAEDNGDGTYSYIRKLNTIFSNLKTTGINELILDLRYNSGGYVKTCIELSSMIANRNESDILFIDQYNKIIDAEGKKEIGPDYNKTYFANNIGRYNSNGNLIETIPINKLPGLNRLYVITSNRTASASEGLINGLKAYMDVILIGDVTVGKNVGMLVIHEEDAEKQKTNKWGMAPIIVKEANAKGFSDYGNGFKPDVKADEYTYLPILPLGDTNETLLQAALVKMGVMQTSTSLRANKEHTFIPVASSIDRTPARKNRYINKEIIPKKQF